MNPVPAQDRSLVFSPKMAIKLVQSKKGGRHAMRQEPPAAVTARRADNDSNPHGILALDDMKKSGPFDNFSIKKIRDDQARAHDDHIV